MRKGSTCSEELRKKLSESHKGHHNLHSDETKKKMSLAHKGKKFSVEHRKNISLSHKGILTGRKLSEEHKRNISLGNKGQIPWIKGKHWPKNTKEQRIKNLLKIVNARPNKFETRALAYLELIYPNKFKYTGNGSFIVSNRSADAYSKELNTIALFNGCYWHLKRKGYEITEENKRIVERFESQPFLNADYKVLFIWEDELKLILKK